MSAQLWALAVAGAVVLVAACLEAIRARRARRRALANAGPSGTSGHLPMNGEGPYLIYFTGDSCAVCRTHQEPALAKLDGIRIDKVDAVADRALADRFHVYTLPTTVVMGADGHALHVNYGYAPAPKLERQLAEARVSTLSAASA